MKINTKQNVWLPLVLAAALLSSLNTDAATLTVTSTADSGPGTLRAALANASNGDTIDTTGVSGTILLTSGELLVSNSVTIIGPGPTHLAVDGNATSRVFHITNAISALIAGLTITNGSATAPFPGSFGGGTYNDRSALTVSNCGISGNSAASGGGGMYNSHSTLTVVNCNVSGNSALGGYGGGIYNDGSGSHATLIVFSSTLSSNSAFDGGGIFNNGESSGTGTVNVTNSTFSSNSASDGGGIWNDGSASGTANLAVSASTFNGNSADIGASLLNDGAGATLDIGDTILNVSGVGGANIYNIVGPVNSHGYNLCSDSGAGFFTNATDQINTNPMLGPLQDNGGPTFTHALLPGSPAIDNGKSFGVTTDQRSAPRPFDFSNIANASSGDGSDIGAFELGSPSLNFQQVGNNAVLSWPSYYGDFNLQSSTNIASSNSWITADGSRAVVGSQYQQTNNPISGSKFFRLKQQ